MPNPLDLDALEAAAAGGLTLNRPEYRDTILALIALVREKEAEVENPTWRLLSDQSKWPQWAQDEWQRDFRTRAALTTATEALEAIGTRCRVWEENERMPCYPVGACIGCIARRALDSIRPESGENDG